MSHQLDYASPRAEPRRRRLWRRLRLAALCVSIYVIAYVALRARGTLYLFFNQGSYSIEMSDQAPWPVLVFLPLMVMEGEYHDLHTAPPPGG